MPNAAPTHPAALPEAELLANCEIRRQRRSGPGGQHRNKVETAVVITHLPTGVQGSASERRSQEENRRVALSRLRVNLAITVRSTPAPIPWQSSDLWRSRCREGRLSISAEHPDFPAMLAEALDCLSTTDWEAPAAAELLGCSASQLVKLLQKEGRGLVELNSRRAGLGRSPYR